VFGDASLAIALKVAALDQAPHLLRQRGGLLLFQLKPAGKLEFVGGRITRLTQQGEQTISK
jgi:hypothetical protein